VNHHSHQEEAIREATETGDISLDNYVYWVEARAGIPGNEMADQLAKAAARKKKASSYSRIP